LVGLVVEVGVSLEGTTRVVEEATAKGGDVLVAFLGFLDGGVADTGGEASGLGAVETVELPGGAGGLFDEVALDFVAGFEVGIPGVHTVLVFGWVFAGDDGGAGGGAVLEGVPADHGFAFGGARTGAALGVFAVGVDAGLGGHGAGSWLRASPRILERGTVLILELARRSGCGILENDFWGADVEVIGRH
jgi:hypothetical protein